MNHIHYFGNLVIFWWGGFFKQIQVVKPSTPGYRIFSLERNSGQPLWLITASDGISMNILSYMWDMYGICGVTTCYKLLTGSGSDFLGTWALPTADPGHYDRDFRSLWPCTCDCRIQRQPSPFGEHKTPKQRRLGDLTHENAAMTRKRLDAARNWVLGWVAGCLGTKTWFPCWGSNPGMWTSKTQDFFGSHEAGF